MVSRPTRWPMAQTPASTRKQTARPSAACWRVSTSTLERVGLAHDAEDRRRRDQPQQVGALARRVGDDGSAVRDEPLDVADGRGAVGEAEVEHDQSRVEVVGQSSASTVGTTPVEHEPGNLGDRLAQRERDDLVIIDENYTVRVHAANP